MDPSGLYSFGEWQDDFLRGSVIVSGYGCQYRHVLGSAGGLLAGLVTLDPLVGVATGVLITGHIAAAGGEAPADVVLDAAIGGSGAGELMLLTNQASLGYQYHFGNF